MASGGSTKVVLAAVSGNSIITVAKFIAWFFSASPSMLAEAIHSFADTFNQLLLYVGIRHSSTPESREFPYGYGQASYVWNLISAMGVFFIGCGVTIYHGIHSFNYAHEVTEFELNPLVLGVLVFALLVEGYVLLIAWKEVRKVKKDLSLGEYMDRSDDPTTLAVLLEDGVAVLGVVIAMAGILLSYYLKSGYPDAIASILIGVLLGIMALLLAFSNGRLLIGRAVDESIEDDIRELLESLPSIERVESLKTRVIGPGSVRLSLELELHGSALIDRDLLQKEAEEIRSQKEQPLKVLVESSRRMVRVVGNEINQIERKIMKHFPVVKVIDLEVN